MKAFFFPWISAALLVCSCDRTAPPGNASGASPPGEPFAGYVVGKAYIGTDSAVVRTELVALAPEARQNAPVPPVVDSTAPAGSSYRTAVFVPPAPPEGPTTAVASTLELPRVRRRRPQYVVYIANPAEVLTLSVDSTNWRRLVPGMRVSTRRPAHGGKYEPG